MLFDRTYEIETVYRNSDRKMPQLPNCPQHKDMQSPFTKSAEDPGGLSHVCDPVGLERSGAMPRPLYQTASEHGLPGETEKFWALKDYALKTQTLASLLTKRTINESREKMPSATPKVGKSLSSCHLKKHILINSLWANLDERTVSGEDVLQTLPPKISPFLQEGQRQARQAPRIFSSSLPA